MHLHAKDVNKQDRRDAATALRKKNRRVFLVCRCTSCEPFQALIPAGGIELLRNVCKGGRTTMFRIGVVE